MIVLIKYTVPPLTVLLAEQGTRIFLERPSQQKGLSGGIIICHFLISAGPSSPFLILVMGRCHRVSCVVIYSTGRRQSYRYSGNSSGGALVTRWRGKNYACPALTLWMYFLTSSQLVWAPSSARGPGSRALNNQPPSHSQTSLSLYTQSRSLSLYTFYAVPTGFRGFFVGQSHKIMIMIGWHFVTLNSNIYSWNRISNFRLSINPWQCGHRS